MSRDILRRFSILERRFSALRRGSSSAKTDWTVAGSKLKMHSSSGFRESEKDRNGLLADLMSRCRNGGSGGCSGGGGGGGRDGSGTSGSLSSLRGGSLRKGLVHMWGSLWKRFSRGELSTGSGNDIGAECCFRGTGRGIGDMIIAPVGGLGSDLKYLHNH